MKHLTWAEFDAAIESISAMANGLALSGVYGIPRGGLPLAVALSHRLGVPLLHQVLDGCLLVDDVYETGRTLEPLRGTSVLVVVWVSKVPPTWFKAVETLSTEEWLVFPWENPAKAITDEDAYRASRK